MSTETQEACDLFVAELARGREKGEAIGIQCVPGSPDTAPAEAWALRSWVPGALVHPRMNNYVCISALAGGRPLRRTKDRCARALAFVVDDVGTKVPRSAVEGRAEPTAVVETSPGNEQWWYFFSTPATPTEIEALQVAFVAAAGLRTDPGMRDVNRVMRLPRGVNGKASLGEPWPVRFSRPPDYTRRWEAAELADRLGCVLRPPRVRVRTGGDVPPDPAAADEFRALLDVCRKQGLVLQRHIGRENGRIAVRCPWSAFHTNKANNGSYLTEPNERNHWRGGWVCYHDRCRRAAVLWRKAAAVGLDLDAVPRVGTLGSRLLRRLEDETPAHIDKTEGAAWALRDFADAVLGRDAVERQEKAALANTNNADEFALRIATGEM